MLWINFSIYFLSTISWLKISLISKVSNAICMLLINFIFLLPQNLNLLFQQFRSDCQSFRNIVCFINANHFLCEIKHIVSQANNYKLAILGLLPNIFSNNRHIFVIKSSINFIHAIKWARFI